MHIYAYIYMFINITLYLSNQQCHATDKDGNRIIHKKTTMAMMVDLRSSKDQQNHFHEWKSSPIPCDRKMWGISRMIWRVDTAFNTNVGNMCFIQHEHPTFLLVQLDKHIDHDKWLKLNHSTNHRCTSSRGRCSKWHRRRRQRRQRSRRQRGWRGRWRWRSFSNGGRSIWMMHDDVINFFHATISDLDSWLNWFLVVSNILNFKCTWGNDRILLILKPLPR